MTGVHQLTVYLRARPPWSLHPQLPTDSTTLRPIRAWARIERLRNQTFAAQTGASAAEIMRRGGHASPTVAMRYQHATADRDRMLADRLDELAAGCRQAPIPSRC
jgi:hypothetical protein